MRLIDLSITTNRTHRQIRLAVYLVNRITQAELIVRMRLNRFYIDHYKTGLIIDSINRSTCYVSQQAELIVDRLIDSYIDHYKTELIADSINRSLSVSQQAELI
ncbi:hypothetical protein AVEN_106178-1 [Araneus ventricosus]|uniref:Uncharacterized protein n=1 Tax=Araneus ventricosus TaxID=182803 RepID=A0A4Y2SWC2_ARAVE|nr:hypothetical protein AVEN_106178-1 [Araneus ventricosus]